MEKVKYTKYRYVIEGVWLITALVQSISWQSISPVLENIIADISMSYSQGGVLITVVQLVAGISIFFGTKIIEKLGIKKTTLIGLFSFFIGNFMTYTANNYIYLLLARIIVGIGFGLFVGIAGAQTMIWFPPQERTIINTLNSIIGTLGFGISFLITVPLNELLGSWRNIFLIYAIYALIVMILQCVFVKEIKLEQNKENTGLKKAISYSKVKYLMIIMIGILWGYNIFTTYFPSYLQKYKYISPSSASSITGMIPLIGVMGTFITGVIVNKIRKRKIFVLVSILFMIIGIIGSVYSNNNISWTIFSGFIGIAFSSFSLLYQIILMEIPNINANVVAGGIAWINGINNILVFLTPFIFDWINQLYNMQIAFLFFVIINFISIGFAYKIVEQ